MFCPENSTSGKTHHPPLSHLLLLLLHSLLTPNLGPVFMAVLALIALVLVIMADYSDATYCVCKSELSDSVLQATIDYACGAGADCTAIMQNGACYQPNTVKAHCSYAVNSYFQRKGQTQGSCVFSNTASTTESNPSPPGSGCVYPSSASSTGNNTNIPPSILTPPTGGGTTPGGTPTPPQGGGTTPGTPTPPLGGGTTPGTPTPPLGGGTTPGTPLGGGTTPVGGGGFGLGPSTTPFGTNANHASDLILQQTKSFSSFLSVLLVSGLVFLMLG